MIGKRRRIFVSGFFLTLTLLFGILYFETMSPARIKQLHDIANKSYKKMLNDSLKGAAAKGKSAEGNSLISSLDQAIAHASNNSNNAKKDQVSDLVQNLKTYLEASKSEVSQPKDPAPSKPPEENKPAVVEEYHREPEPYNLKAEPNPAQFYDVSVPVPGDNSRQMTIGISKHYQLNRITHSWAEKDRFSPHENALFALRRYQSPWLLQFRPPIPIDFKSSICKGSPPFLLIVIPSSPTNRMSRMAIRQTWGSVGSSGAWPHRKVNAKVQVLFSIGHEVISPNLHHLIRLEKDKYQDILEFNMTEDYRKLTVKMLGILRWVNTNCPGVGFFLKADEDSFINVPLFVDYLLINQKSLSRSVMGAMYNAPPVRRWGKWRVSILEYPFQRFPTYASGSSYLIAGNAIGDIIKASEFFIPIAIEDAFITGILSKAAGITRYHCPAMAMMGEVTWSKGVPPMCDFLASRLAMTDCTVEIFDRIWLASQVDYCGTHERWGLEDIGNQWTFKRVSY
ncbi:UDP-GlcNAc:betaGal beta-1,3-N-acetylglucosaminyltransferase 7-like [Physella acuta]|uniref:UDP-GlcNAc:betaGal beta-1,3-N-acetylglucosaminyltransferase 7-like n=1 Tax=Physella acuta TaxID=109671 RepID=UPI0027DD2E65|nr:UDP-GlcNAc:betaGal beta-1,3-N-acetylglucosaminyltransferase 7-like [Physella acuta]